ncbi:MAG: FtsX-like permease family protein, partial [Candidatus Syntrophonatronum acetioxidans]
TVAGVCESVASQFSAFAGGFDSEMEGRGGIPFFVYSPFMTISSIVPDHNRLSTLNVMAVEPERVDEAGEAVISLLEMRRGNRDSSVYRSQNLASILDQINNVINILTWFISTVAGISLFVGGIGVMNIMLVSVAERTREIGIRKAIGATKTDILLQFMTESVVLTLMGGAMGILAGLGLAYGISAAADSLGIAQITPVLSLQAIIIAVAFSTGVGLFFGIYPARKAANLHPIDALRHN